MVARRSQVGIVMVAVLSLATALPEAAASPARRLARRGVLLAPPPGTAILPPAGPLRPNPLLAVPVAPGGPSVVIGPGGRVRRRLTIPPAVVPGQMVTVTENVTEPYPAATRPAPAPAPAALQSASPAPLVIEQVPAPLPTPQPGTASGVVPAGAELEIPDGTQSVLVAPAGGAAPQPAGR